MMNEVRKGLYIGDIESAIDILQNGSDKITHVLCFRKHRTFSHYTKLIPAINSGDVHKFSSPEFPASYLIGKAGKDLKFTRMAVPLNDDNKGNILVYLDACLDFIEKGRQNGGVLVHCYAGVSRSATAVAAYLIRSERLSAADAIASLQQRRPVVYPRENFLKQLDEFELLEFIAQLSIRDRQRDLM